MKKNLPLFLLAGAAGLVVWQLAAKAANSGTTGIGLNLKPNRLLPDNPRSNVPYVTAEGHSRAGNAAYIWNPASGWRETDAFDAVQGIFYQGYYTGDRVILDAAQNIWNMIQGQPVASQQAGFVWELVT